MKIKVKIANGKITFPTLDKVELGFAVVTTMVALFDLFLMYKIFASS